MIKIASLTFDVYDDVTGEIAHKLPSDLHAIKVASHEEVEALHDHQFALVIKTASGIRRRYPLDNPDAIKLSQAYFDQVKDTMHPALAKVAEEKFAAIEKLAYETDDGDDGSIFDKPMQKLHSHGKPPWDSNDPEASPSKDQIGTFYTEAIPKFLKKKNQEEWHFIEQGNDKFHHVITQHSTPEEIRKAVDAHLSNGASVVHLPHYFREAKKAAAKVAYVDATLLEPTMEKVAFTHRVYGLVIDGRECFPLHDAMLVKTAIARFPGMRGELDSAECFQFARTIQKQASALGVIVPHDSPIRLYTADELNLHSLNLAIGQRKEAAGTRVGTEVLDQLAQAAGCEFKQGEMETPDSYKMRQKIASGRRQLSADQVIAVLGTFDKFAGFGSFHYMRGMLDPFAACFKLAGYECNQMMVDGVDLSKIDPERLNSKFDTEFVNEFKQNPVQVYQSSPDPIKSVIREMAKQPLTGSKITAGEGDPVDQLNPMLSNPLKA